MLVIDDADALLYDRSSAVRSWEQSQIAEAEQTQTDDRLEHIDSDSQSSDRTTQYSAAVIAAEIIEHAGARDRSKRIGF